MSHLVGPLQLRHHELGHRGATPIGVHHTLRLAGRATRVRERRQVLAIHRWSDERLRRERRREAHQVVTDVRLAEREQSPEPGDALAQLPSTIGEGRVEQQRLDAGVFEHVGVVVERPEWVQRSVPTPAHHHRAHRVEDLDAVLRQRRHATPQLDALRAEGLDVPADLVAHLGRRAHLAIDVDGGAVSVPRRARGSADRAGTSGGRDRSFLECFLRRGRAATKRRARLPRAAARWPRFA